MSIKTPRKVKLLGKQVWESGQLTIPGNLRHQEVSCKKEFHEQKHFSLDYLTFEKHQHSAVTRAGKQTNIKKEEIKF